MKNHVVALFVLIASALLGQTRVVGPYTLHPIIPGVIRVEDANSSNPSGIHRDAEGNVTGYNNCSDMYLIVGSDRALLIDLSQAISWDDTAVVSLQALVAQEIGERELFIAVTHSHGDHTGMLPAFKDNAAVTFWIQTAEFAGRDLFPSDRTTPIAAFPSIDLGGDMVVDAVEIPGHTGHSTAYFLRGKNLLFSGDGLGSGNGVWIFSADGFTQYRHSITKLIDYIRDPAHHVDANQLLVFGAHYWQKREKEKLTMQYLRDMQTLIGEIKTGTAREEKVTFNRFLDTNFIYGEATITWNKAAAEQFRAE